MEPITTATEELQNRSRTIHTCWFTIEEETYRANRVSRQHAQDLTERLEVQVDERSFNRFDLVQHVPARGDAEEFLPITSGFCYQNRLNHLRHDGIRRNGSGSRTLRRVSRGSALGSLHFYLKLLEPLPIYLFTGRWTPARQRRPLASQAPSRRYAGRRWFRGSWSAPARSRNPQA